MGIFADVYFLIKCLQVAITPNQDIWDSIANIVALNFLHDDFKTTTTNMLKRKDKIINKIQQILASTKAKFISKHGTGVTGDLAIMSQEQNSRKQKASSNNKCYNC